MDLKFEWQAFILAVFVTSKGDTVLVLTDLFLLLVYRKRLARREISTRDALRRCKSSLR